MIDSEVSKSTLAFLFHIKWTLIQELILFRYVVCEIIEMKSRDRNTRPENGGRASSLVWSLD